MNKTKIFGLIICILFVASSLSAQGVDPSVRDSISIDSVITASSNTGFVPISFFNDEDLAGIEVTLTYNSADIFIDSFSFVDGRLENYTLKGADQLTSSSITIYSYVLDENLITSGEGLMGYLFFSFIPNISPQVVTIDTMTLAVGDRVFATTFSDATANAFTPYFDEGYLDIRSNTCCLGDRGNIDGSPNDQVDISDLLFMVDYMFRDDTEPPCLAEANVNGSIDEQVDISDLLFLVDYMFIPGSPAPSSCP